MIHIILLPGTVHDMNSVNSGASASTQSSFVLDPVAEKYRLVGKFKKKYKTSKEERRSHKQSLQTHSNLFESLGPTLGVTVSKPVQQSEDAEDVDCESLTTRSIDELYDFDVINEEENPLLLDENVHLGEQKMEDEQAKINNF